MKDVKNIELFPHVSFVDKLLFTKHLSIMIKSGITLSESLETLIDQAKSPYFRTVLTSVLHDIENGESLSKALSKLPKVFDQLYISLIEIGEESGTLEKNLEFLAGQLAKNYALVKKVQGAMLYPAIILTAATIIGAGVAFFVLPQLLDLFNSLDVKLPLSTQILIFIAHSVKDYGIFILMGLVAFVVGFRFAIEQPKIKPYWHRIILKLPLIGPFLKHAQLVSFCRNLGIMLNSGLSITKALEIEEKAATNIVFKEYVARIQTAVDKGQSIAGELTTGKFVEIPPIATKMIGVGEKTGKLDEVLLYLGDFFEDEVDNEAKNFSTILEPIMLLGIGCVVAFVALSIIAPIYQLSGSVKK